MPEKFNYVYCLYLKRSWLLGHTTIMMLNLHQGLKCTNESRKKLFVWTDDSASHFEDKVVLQKAVWWQILINLEQKKPEILDKYNVSF